MDSTDLRRLSRLTAIVTQLQTKRLLTATALSQAFGVSLRTIYRDIRALEAAGIPVVTVEGKGYRLMEGYRLPPVMFTEGEANALVTVGQLLQKEGSAALRQEYASALSKVTAVLQQPAREKAALLSERIAVSPAFAPEPAGSALLLLQTALTSFEALAITYKARGTGEITERVVEPFALYHSREESWLLIAYCRLRRDFRMFRLDGLLLLRPTGLAFAPHRLTLAQFLAEKEKNFQTPDTPLSQARSTFVAIKATSSVMNLLSIRIITADLSRLTAFYEQVTGVAAVRYTEDFAELQTGCATLAIGSTRTLQLFGGDAVAGAAQNRSVIIEFITDDVDEAYSRLADFLEDSLVQPPTTMPWGNRSLLFRDPDGNLVNFFTPVSPEAMGKFAGKLA